MSYILGFNIHTSFYTEQISSQRHNNAYIHSYTHIINNNEHQQYAILIPIKLNKFSSHANNKTRRFYNI